MYAGCVSGEHSTGLLRYKFWGALRAIRRGGSDKLSGDKLTGGDSHTAGTARASRTAGSGLCKMRHGTFEMTH